MDGSRRSPGGERLRPGDRLRNRRDFTRCYRRGERFHGSIVVLHVHPGECRGPRPGITASRKVGNAVVRHRMKRRTREIFRRWPGRRELGPVDVVVHLRPGRPEPGFHELHEELEKLLGRVARRKS